MKVHGAFDLVYFPDLRPSRPVSEVFKKKAKGKEDQMQVATSSSTAEAEKIAKAEAEKAAKDTETKKPPAEDKSSAAGRSGYDTSRFNYDSSSTDDTN